MSVIIISTGVGLGVAAIIGLLWANEKRGYQASLEQAFGQLDHAAEERKEFEKKVNRLYSEIEQFNEQKKIDEKTNEAHIAELRQGFKKNLVLSGVLALAIGIFAGGLTAAVGVSWKSGLEAQVRQAELTYETRIHEARQEWLAREIRELKKEIQSLHQAKEDEMKARVRAESKLEILTGMMPEDASFAGFSLNYNRVKKMLISAPEKPSNLKILEPAAV